MNAVHRLTHQLQFVVVATLLFAGWLGVLILRKVLFVGRGLTFHSATFPSCSSARFGVGAQYRCSESLNLGAAYTFMCAGDMSVDQGSLASLRGRVSGSLDDTWFSIASLRVIYTF